MEICIESTQEFEQDLAAFSQTKKANIVNQMNEIFEIISHNPDALFQNMTLKQFKKIKLNNNYNSSLYSLTLEAKIRIILAIDDDPIFDRTLITLFRIVSAENASEAYNSVAESLYQDFTMEKQAVIAVLC